MEYYSAVKRNKTESFVETWMNLESVTYSEVSQKEKKIMYQYIYVKSEKKNQYGLPYLQSRKRNMNEGNKHADTKGGR